MCRVASLQVELAPTAARTARAWASEQLHNWELDQLNEPATLVISELVTNAVVHAHSAPLVSLAVAQDHLEIGCSDDEVEGASDTLYDITQGEALGLGGAIRREGGRGLRIVDAVASTWGQEPTETGKHVWCRISVDAWAYQSDCRCHIPSPERVVLPSGQSVRHNEGPWDDGVARK
jgi:anti-sigma regulatory factor (Ser/Thr protein kinase)